MNRRETLGLVEVYSALSNPEFVVRHGQLIADEACYTLKAVAKTSLLGEVTVESIFRADKREIAPVMLISEKQSEILREHNIRVVKRKRIHPTCDEMYICFLDGGVVKKIA